MIDLKERRIQRTVEVFKDTNDRYYVTRFRDGYREFLQYDGTWSTSQGNGWDSAEEAQKQAESHRPKPVHIPSLNIDGERLLEIFAEAGFPCHGYLAEWLWNSLSHLLPYSAGKEIYEALGYVPFNGYPLLRAERTFGPFFDNFVPDHLRNDDAGGMITHYGVFVFLTQEEYEQASNRHPDHRYIEARFRQYSAAERYATSRVFSGGVHGVSLWYL